MYTIVSLRNHELFRMKGKSGSSGARHVLHPNYRFSLSFGITSYFFTVAQQQSANHFEHARSGLLPQSNRVHQSQRYATWDPLPNFLHQPTCELPRSRQGNWGQWERISILAAYPPVRPVLVGSVTLLSRSMMECTGRPGAHACPAT